MSHPTLIDEYGDTGIVQPCGGPCCYEVRRDSTGKRLGPKPLSERRLGYDEKQIRPREAVADVSGQVIDGP